MVRHAKLIFLYLFKLGAGLIALVLWIAQWGVGLIGLALAVSLLYLQINEDTLDPCEAIAKRVVYLKYGEYDDAPLIMANENYRADGERIRNGLKVEVSDVIPPDLTCGVFYMWSIFNKKGFLDLIAQHANSSNPDGDVTIPNLTQPFGTQDVWNGPVPNCAGDPNQGACLKKAMIAGGASPQALAFAAKANFQYYLSEFQGEGRVSPGLITTIGGANNNEQPVLLNGVTPVIQVWGLTNPPVMNISEIKKTHPYAGTYDHPPRFESATSTPSGGQSFIYRVIVSDCHICNLAEYNEIIKFDAYGNLVGNSVGGITKGADSEVTQ